MDLSAVVVNWNSGEHLRRLVESLGAAALRRVVIVDNDSDDGSAEGLCEHPEVELIRAGCNLGFAAAANRGIRQTKTQFLLLLNPDVELRDTMLDPLLDEIRRRPDVALACPALVDAATGQPQSTFQCRPLPTLKSVIADALFLDHLPGRGAAGRRAPAASARSSVEVEQPAAACWLLRRQAWEELGGFDESFFPAWFEDVDFCRRLADAGWRLRLVGSQRALHHGGHSLQRLGREEFTRIYYSNLLRYWRKHHRRSYPLVWLPVRLGLAARLWRVRR